MIRTLFALSLFAGSAIPAFAGQAPFAAMAANIPVGHKDRFYSSDQF